MSEKSSEMMSLLQELALLKQLDADPKGELRSAAETNEFESRQNRRKEIADRIKALGNPLLS
jgi:hypothetical protein